MSQLTSKIFRITKNVVLTVIVILCIVFIYKTLKSFLAKRKLVVADKPLDFSPNDIVNFVPKLGSCIDVSSDRTADAILSGTYGPAVVVFVAEWCNHCRNMNAALEEAAKASNVPFVRVDGPKAPVSGQKYAVSGYPSVFGVSNVGGPPRRYASLRTPEALLEFARGLSGTPAPVVLAPLALPEAPVAAVPVAAAAPSAAVPLVAAAPSDAASPQQVLASELPTVV